METEIGLFSRVCGGRSAVNFSFQITPRAQQTCVSMHSTAVLLATAFLHFPTCRGQFPKLVGARFMKQRAVALEEHRGGVEVIVVCWCSRLCCALCPVELTMSPLLLLLGGSQQSAELSCSGDRSPSLLEREQERE